MNSALTSPHYGDRMKQYQANMFNEEHVSLGKHANFLYITRYVAK